MKDLLYGSSSARFQLPPHHLYPSPTVFVSLPALLPELHLLSFPLPPAKSCPCFSLHLWAVDKAINQSLSSLNVSLQAVTSMPKGAPAVVGAASEPPAPLGLVLNSPEICTPALCLVPLRGLETPKHLLQPLPHGNYFSSTSLWGWLQPQGLCVAEHNWCFSLTTFI